MSTQIAGVSVAAVSRIELIYVRQGGSPDYGDAVVTPIDMLVNALGADAWVENPRSPLGTEFTRTGSDTGTERLVIVNRQGGVG